MEEDVKRKIEANLHRGVPNANVEFEDGTLRISLGSEIPLEGLAEEPVEEPMAISLDKIVVELHNQSYGMLMASTGCISNPGGPSC